MTQAGLRLSEQGEAENISAGKLNALRITDGSTQSVFLLQICNLLYKSILK